MIVKGIRMSGAHGMPEGAELVLGSLELEVDSVLPAEHFRCSKRHSQAAMCVATANMTVHWPLSGCWRHEEPTCMLSI